MSDVEGGLEIQLPEHKAINPAPLDFGGKIECCDKHQHIAHGSEFWYQNLRSMRVKSKTYSLTKESK